MQVIRARNVHQALPQAIDLLASTNVLEESRNGNVLVSPCPVATVYEKPCERVLFHSWRNANPFFHFYESLWMLAGRCDVEPIARYVGRMKEFSDDGIIQHAAYGWRWRRQFGVDQLMEIGERLKANPTDRRCVLQIWSAQDDLMYDGKDAACNVSATFQIRDGRLNMVVLCRSNDIIWGCYGANAVHFSMLLEYMAWRIGVPAGTYTQVSVNWHAYEDVWSPMMRRFSDHRAWTHHLGDHMIHQGDDPYEAGACEPHPIMSMPAEVWDEDCRRFIRQDGMAPTHDRFDDPFFKDVALPIVRSHDSYKNGDITDALAEIQYCKASDWKLACIEWLTRKAGL